MTIGRLFSRAATLVLMLLTTATAWAFKTEAPVTYTVSRSDNTISIKNGSTTTASWTASETIGINTVYYWKADESHALSNGMSVKPSNDVYVDVSSASAPTSTTFTFTAPSNIAITGVTFKKINTVLDATSSEPGTTFKVTLASGESFSGFVVTYGYISGTCEGSSTTWSLDKENGQYTALTIGGSGDMIDYDGSNTPWDNDLTSATISSDITKIGNYAFNGCAKLTRVNVQKTDGLVTLSSSAFNGCDALAAIVAPTPALAVEYKSAANWSAHAEKMCADFGGYAFRIDYTTTADAAYAVADDDDLRHLADAVNAGNNGSSLTFRQTADITFTGGSNTQSNYTAIGTAIRTAIGTQSRSFNGTFNGQNHVVRGIRIYQGGIDEADHYQGLFGNIGSGAKVENVILADARITGNDLTGGIAGYNSGTIENCHVLNNVTVHAVQSTCYHHGGIVGSNRSTVTGCTSAAAVTTADNLTGCHNYGGIAGNNGATVKDCIYLGTTLGGTQNVGTIVGYNTSTVQNCYFTDTNICGKDENGDALTNASSAVGYNSSGTVTNCGPAYILTLGEGITLDATATNYGPITAYDDNAVSYNNGTTTTLYSGTGQTLTLSYTGDVPDGYTACFTVKDANDNDITATNLSGNTLTMPAKNVTVSSNTGKLRSTGQAVAVSYFDENGDEQTVNAIALDGTEESLAAGWYFVGSDISNTSGINFTGDANLILEDNAEMNVTVDGGAAIYLNDGNLTIYGQANETGILNAQSKCHNGIMAVGKSLTINGGNVNATGNDISAYNGISTYNGNVTINGGKVNATGGIWAEYGIVTINGGKVNATGGIWAESGTITINGGNVNATGDFGIWSNKGTINLGWTRATDRITATGFSGTVNIKSGQTLYDGATAYTGDNVTMPSGTVTLRPFSSDDLAMSTDGTEYTIKTAEGWNTFCDLLAEGETFSGKTVSLDANIGTAQNPITRMTGGTFQGTFDGNGKTLTVNINDASGKQGTAPFRNIAGATIKDLKVVGSVTGSTHSAGLVGLTSSGSNTIVNCIVSANVSITNSSIGNFVGGIVGYACDATINMAGCVFNGSLSLVEPYNYYTNFYYAGGLIGWCGVDGQGITSNTAPTLNITNCFSTGTYKNYAADHFHPIIVKWDGITVNSENITNNYYTGDPTVTAYSYSAHYVNAGKPARTITAGDDVAIINLGDETEYDVSGITAYAHGIKFDGTYYAGNGDEVSLTLSHTNKDGYTFKNYTATGGTLNGNTLTMPDADVTIGAQWERNAFELADNADNSGVISTWKDKMADVTLQGRTLYKDGYWNTLCLPFSIADINAKDASDNFICPLHGATVKTLVSSNFSGGTLSMNFTEDKDNITAIEAGKPYIVKWDATTPDYIENPTFTGVTISNASTNVETEYVDFVGSYSPVNIAGEDRSILFLGTSTDSRGTHSTLFYPNAAMTINSCRAYFQLNKGLTAGDPAAVKEFKLNFGDDDSADGIENVQCSMFNVQCNDAWYTLDGRRLGGKPTKSGLYIHNGKKVLK